MAGSNSFALTPKRWIEVTNAFGIISKTGRFGGTFAHKDIAFEFLKFSTLCRWVKEIVAKTILKSKTGFR